MTTQIINGTFTAEVNAFRSPAQSSSPLPFLFAIADCVRQQGRAWLRTDEAKALLFPVLQMTYGPMFQLDSMNELTRLDQSIPLP